MNGYCVIIDAHLLEPRLLRCLAMVRRVFRSHASQVELNLVAKTRSDELEKISRYFNARLEIINQPTAGARLNTAARGTTQELLVFPGHCGRFKKNALVRYRELFKERGWDAAVLSPQEKGLFERFNRLWLRQDSQPLSTLCVSREWFERIGGFDAQLDASAYQDLLSRLLACNAHVIELAL
ncbi:hypothetical protein [Pistricoccus aurantiacus]|uniref:hypothetical protein n=1 Tax=Pistricoccus aurantiacus TaxID=1883414 RepID=UPI00362F84B7